MHQKWWSQEEARHRVMAIVHPHLHLPANRITPKGEKMLHWSGIAAIALLATSHGAFAEQPSFTKGRALTTDPGLFHCGPSARVSAVGTIISEDGKVWVVPAETHFKTAPKAADLYNECSGNKPAKTSDLDFSTIPILEAGGSEEFVAYLFADNYFEFYVNGMLIAVDPVPFTPFNSSIIRFKASRPLTLALKLVDWEENLGLGSERGRGSSFQPGDGGIVIHLKNAAGKTMALTDTTWRAQTFYTGPLKDRSCLKVLGQVRNSAACDTSGAQDGTSFSSAFWPLPSNWMAADFDDSSWPAALTFTNEVVGVNGKPAYTNFADIFDAPGNDPQFIWSSNLILDNLVLIRKTIK
jgi:hypothetical protein